MIYRSIKMTNVYSNKISQAIIQYLCHSAGYTHTQVAILSNLPIETILAIYNYKSPMTPTETHIKLLKLYSIAVELEERYLKNI